MNVESNELKKCSDKKDKSNKSPSDKTKRKTIAFFSPKQNGKVESKVIDDLQMNDSKFASTPIRRKTHGNESDLNKPIVQGLTVKYVAEINNNNINKSNK